MSFHIEYVFFTVYIYVHIHDFKFKNLLLRSQAASTMTSPPRPLRERVEERDGEKRESLGIWKTVFLHKMIQNSRFLMVFLLCSQNQQLFNFGGL